MLRRSTPRGCVAHVDAADEHRAGRRLHNRQTSAPERGLAAARRSHHRHHAPGRDRERDVAQRGLTAGVGEGEAPELERTGRKESGRGRRGRSLVRPIGRPGHRVQDLGDPLHRRQPAAHDGQRPAQRHGGPGQIGQVSVEGHEGAQRDAALGHGPPTDPEDDQGAQPRRPGPSAARSAPECGPGAGCASGTRRWPAEALDLPRLHRVGAHHRHAGEVLLHLARRARPAAPGRRRTARPPRG